MSCRIFVGREAGCEDEDERAVLFDSTTGRVFGRFFDSEEAAESFLDWCRNEEVDPRECNEPTFDLCYRQWEATRS